MSTSAIGPTQAVQPTVISDSNLVYYRLGENPDARLSQATVEKFFIDHNVVITSITVVEWISKHSADLAAIQKLLQLIDLTEGPLPISGLYVDVSLLKRIRDASTLAEVSSDIDSIIEQRVQAEAEMLRFTLVFLLLAFDIGVAEARLTDPIKQFEAVVSMAMVLQSNLDYLKDHLIGILRPFHARTTRGAIVNKQICELIGGLAEVSLINYHCCRAGVGTSRDGISSILAAVSQDQLLRKVRKANQPLDVLKVVGNKDVRKAVPDYLPKLGAVLKAYGVGAETISYWCSRLSKSLQAKKIPAKNDMLDMLVLDAIRYVDNGILATADSDLCKVLQEHHTASYHFLQQHLPDALPK